MSNRIIIGIIIAIIMIAGGIFLFSKGNTASPRETSQPTSLPTTAEQSQNIVIYTSDGFSPANLVIKVGTKVVWKNEAGSLSVNSSPHPTHTDYSPLNLGIIGKGELKSLIFDKPGTYRYHNHLNPSHKGTVNVE